MDQAYPNHFISIPRSLVSLKHYSEVHDQPFTRTLLYLVILAVLLTVLGVGIDLVGHTQRAAVEQKALAERLEGLSVQDGTATAPGEQPRVLWEERPGGPKGRRAMVVVLDTTGELEEPKDAAAFAGCPQSDRILFFGRTQVQSYQRQGEGEETKKPETISYEDAEALAELRQLVEETGGTFPELSLTDGVARFDLPQGKVHVLCHSPELTVLVDATGQEGRMGEVLEQAIRDDAALRDKLVPPQFLVLVGATGAVVRFVDAEKTAELDYGEGEGLDGAAVARWIASQVRRMRTGATARIFLPYVLMNGLQLFILALLCSVAGLIANAVLHGGLSFTEELTMAVYATLPASLVSLVVMQLAPAVGGDWWGLVVPLGVGMAYVVLGTLTTVRRASAEFQATI